MSTEIGSVNNDLGIGDSTGEQSSNTCYTIIHLDTLLQ